MPSPVITSVAAAASPVSRTRPVASTDAVDARRDRPCRRPSLGRRPGTEGRPDVRRSSRPAHWLAHVLAVARPVAQHAEADVGPPVRQRERPGVAGQEVVVEPDVEVVAGRPGDAADVLPEGVPLAEVAGLGEPGRPAHRAPHAVGGDDVPSRHGRATVDADGDVVVVPAQRPVEPVPLEHRGPGAAGDVDQGGVELAARGDGGVRPGSRRQRHAHLAPRRRPQHGAVDDLPVVDGRRLEAEQPRARAGPASSGRRRSTCRGGTSPCRAR